MTEVERLRALLAEVAGSGVAFQDDRVDYVEVQIDRDTWQELAAFKAAAFEALPRANAAAELLRGLVFMGDEVGPWMDQVARDKCIEAWCKEAAGAIVEAAAREAGLDHES